jgi:hypothetical protein
MTTTGPATAGLPGCQYAPHHHLSPPGTTASIPVRQVGRFTVIWQERREQ